MPWEPARRVENLEKFIQALRDIMPSTAMDHHRYWFRGQSDERWPLQSSFMRSLHDLNLPMTDEIDLEQEALKEFQAKAHFFVSPPLLEKIKTRACWWALMQHHNAPTRLLDWTASPYVAAYFAAHHDGVKANGAVWCFCSRQLRQSFEYEHGPVPDFEDTAAPGWYEGKLLELCGQSVVVPLEFTYASSERMSAQQGRFTMGFNPNESHEGVIEKIVPDHVRKLVIPCENKPEFLLRLREMNITGSALFPGVDGLGYSAKELISLGALYTRATRQESSAAAQASGQS